MHAKFDVNLAKTVGSASMSSFPRMLLFWSKNQKSILIVSVNVLHVFGMPEAATSALVLESSQ